MGKCHKWLHSWAYYNKKNRKCRKCGLKQEYVEVGDGRETWYSWERAKPIPKTKPLFPPLMPIGGWCLHTHLQPTSGTMFPRVCGACNRDFTGVFADGINLQKHLAKIYTDAGYKPVYVLEAVCPNCGNVSEIGCYYTDKPVEGWPGFVTLNTSLDESPRHEEEPKPLLSRAEIIKEKTDDRDEENINDNQEGLDG